MDNTEKSKQNVIEVSKLKKAQKEIESNGRQRRANIMLKWLCEKEN